MKTYIQPNKYDPLVKKIQRRKTIATTLTVIALLLAILFSAPIEMEFLDVAIINYKGINPIVAIIIILFILLCFLISFVVILAPLTASLNIECDPEKHLILNSRLKIQKDMDCVYACDFFYLGNFEVAIDYAKKMTNNINQTIRIGGIFNKSRCEFFLNDFDSMKLTVSQYQTEFANIKKMKPKQREMFEKTLRAMLLMVAIADDDKQKMEDYLNIESWGESKATQGYVNYLKGVAAYKLDMRDEAIYRFMFVKENCSKTILAELAEQYLSNLK